MLFTRLQQDQTALDLFLKSVGIGSVRIIPLPIDASKRYYYRLEGLEKLVMVCPSSEKPEQFLHMSALLSNIGLRAPKVLAQAKDFYLIEDFGTQTDRYALNKSNRQELYTLATDVLIHLKEILTTQPSFVPTYNTETLLLEATLFTEWHKNLRPYTADYIAIWKDLLCHIDAPKGLILRDVHIDNLFYLPQYEGLMACGLIDFQDAVWGPVGYDLVSLTGDARVDVPEDLRQFLKERYRGSFPTYQQENIDKTSIILDMHRQLRILGVFSRLSKRDHKHQYSHHIPRILEYVRHHLENPLFKDLKQWLQNHEALSS